MLYSMQYSSITMSQPLNINSTYVLHTHLLIAFAIHNVKSKSSLAVNVTLHVNFDGHFRNEILSIFYIL